MSASPGAYPCCGGPHTAFEGNPFGHSVSCEHRDKPRDEQPAWVSMVFDDVLRERDERDRLP